MNQAAPEQEGWDAEIKLPPKMVRLFEDEYGAWRFRGAKGGRGSGKTMGFAAMTAVIGERLGQAGYTGQILCCREYQNSLAQSSFAEIKSAIAEHDWLDDYWEVGSTYIRSRDRAIEYTFLGLRQNLDSIKSTARILLCWVEEAETVSETSWSTLVPTVRTQGSEIWLSWNPKTRNNATDLRFVQNPSDDMLIVTMNYRDNPWFPSTLEQDRLNDLALRPDTYHHVWEGDYLEYAEGAYFLDQMKAAAVEGRITHVVHDPAVSVYTAWDLGIDDSTVIWFYQSIGNEIHIIDYYESHDHSLSHYVSVLDEKAKPGAHNRPGYRYGGHVLPHDVKARELGTGKSRQEVLENLGLQGIEVCPMLDIEDGIEAVRNLLAKCFFDEAKCRDGINALRQYRREYDDVRQTFRARPLHDWASHAADAFRYLAVGMPRERNWGKSVKRNLRGMA